MSYQSILKRAWDTIWDYKELWLFGILIALAVGTSQGSGFVQQMSQQRINRTLSFGDQALLEFFVRNFWIFVLIILSLGALGLMISLIFGLARYVGEAALVKMVDDYAETGHRLRLGQGFRRGWSLEAVWLLLLDLVLWLPFQIFFLVLVGVWLVGFIALTFLTVAGEGGGVFVIFLIFWFLGFIALIIFSSVLFRFWLDLLRGVVGRALVLEDRGFFGSLQRGFEVLSRSFWRAAGQVLLLWLINFLAGLGVAFVGLLLLLVALLLGMLPAWASYFLVLLVVGDVLAWLIAVAVFLPLIWLLVILPTLLARGIVAAFTSTTWTYTYRALRDAASRPV